MGDVIIRSRSGIPTRPPATPLQLGSPLTALQSVACLLHWQVLLALAAHLSMKERDVLRCYLVPPPHHAAPSPGTGTSAASASAPTQRIQAAKTAAAKAHQECQRQMLKGTPRALPEAAPLGGAFSRTDYLFDAHFHLHWLVKERLPPQINRSIDLESLRQTFSSQEPSAIPLGTAVDSCLLEPSAAQHPSHQLCGVVGSRGSPEYGG